MMKTNFFVIRTLLFFGLMCSVCAHVFGAQQIYYSEMSTLSGWTEASDATNEAGESTGGIRVVGSDVQFNSWWDTANWTQAYRSIGYTILADKDYTLTVNMISYAASAPVDIKLKNVTEGWTDISTNNVAPSETVVTSYSVSFTTSGGANSNVLGDLLGIEINPGWWNNMLVADVTVTESEPGEPVPVESYSIDLTTQYQTFDGFGVGTIFMQQHLTDGSPSYELPNTYQKLFGDVDNNYHMIWLRADVEAANDNADPFDVDLTAFTFTDVHSDYVTVLTESKAHNPNVKFTAEILSPPGWLKTNGSTVGNGTIDTGVPNAYEEFGEFIFGNLLWYKQQGISFDVLNMMNEPDWTHTEIDGVTYTAAQAKDMIKSVIPHLQALINSSENTEGVVMPLIMMPSTLNTANVNSYVNALKSDGTAWNYVDMISTHHYGESDTATFQAVYDNIEGKPFVMNEWHSANDGNPEADILEVMQQSESIITTMNGGVDSYWWFETNHPTNTVAGLCYQDWGVAAVFGQTYDSWQQWSLMTPIGGKRVDVNKTGGGSGLSYMAVDDNLNNVVILQVLNQNPAAQYIGITIAGESISLIQHNQTNAIESFSPASFSVPVYPAGESVLLVEGQSLNTFELYYGNTDGIAPSSPSNLVADTGNGEVALDWDDNTENDLAGYSVSRSTTPGGPYTEIASGVIFSKYADTSAISGQTYYYVVTATDSSANESGNSNEAESAIDVYDSDMSSLTGWTEESAAPLESGESRGGIRVSGSDVQMNSWWDNADWTRLSQDLSYTIAADKNYKMVARIVGFIEDTPVTLKLENATSSTDIAVNTFNPILTDWGSYEVSFSTAGGQNSDAVGNSLGIIIDAGWWNNILVSDVKVLETNDNTPDTYPPAPDPASFSTLPYATGSDSIAMVATTGSDASGPVEYYFACTAGGGNDSGWQTPASYTDTGLTPETSYSYTVQMRDSLGNTGTASPAESATTDPTGGETTKDYPGSDIAVAGTVSGNYSNTQASDDSYESITERLSGGKPANKYSYLEHKWLINVAGGDTVTFYVEAYHTANSEGDDFVFAYSTTGVDGTYTDMVTVTKTSDDNSAQSSALPSSTSGAVHIRVTDLDSTKGNQVLDTIYIDEMYIESSGGGGTPDTDPPTPDPATWASVPTAVSDSEIAMTAATGTDATGPVEYYFDETSGNPGGTDSGWQTSPTYNDTGLSPSTQYTYIVQMRDSASTPNVGTASAPASATTNGACSPTDMHIEAVICAEVACGGPNKNGQAVVTIYDDCGNPVVNALVTGTFSGDINETIYDVITDSNGQAELTSTACVKRPAFNFAVDSITHGTLPHDSNDDLVTGCSG